MQPKESHDDREKRRLMVFEQLRQRGITDSKVLEVMGRLPRQHFIPPENRQQAYLDQPVSIGLGQTISQPYIVGLMTEKLELRSGSRVLEIGTGCGYQTSILAMLAGKVCTIELLESLAQFGRDSVGSLGITNVEYHIGDGSLGWPTQTSFDRILVAAAATEIPQKLLAQLCDDGKMVIPVGGGDGQRLLLVTKGADRIKETMLCYCRFVKLVQPAQ